MASYAFHCGFRSTLIVAFVPLAMDLMFLVVVLVMSPMALGYDYHSDCGLPWLCELLTQEYLWS